MTPIECLGTVAHFAEIQEQVLALVNELGLDQISLQVQKDQQPHWQASEGWLEHSDLELTFTEIHPRIQGTVLAEFIRAWPVCRTRIMTMQSQARYSLHTDPRPRLHLPIQTNDLAKFLFPGWPPQHLALGQLYRCDTRRIHTYSNLGTEPRIHLVAVLKDES